MASVLVVEDNADLRELYHDILSLDGHTTSFAEDAAQALASMARAQPDILLLDLSIAGGVDAIVAAARATSGARVILVSGACNIAARAVALGAAAHITKPFLPNQLLSTLRRVLGG